MTLAEITLGAAIAWVFIGASCVTRKAPELTQEHHATATYAECTEKPLVLKGGVAGTSIDKTAGPGGALRITVEARDAGN